MTTHLLVPLRTGEIELIRRALAAYAHGERHAMQEAICAAREFPASSKHRLHAEDVRRQVEPRLQRIDELRDRLLKNPTQRSES